MAGTVPLPAPPADLAHRTLEIALVSPTSLCRVPRYHSGEPHFGRSGSCRFDDAQPSTSKRFGTCYLGFDLTVAFAESVLHDLQPDTSGFQVPLTEVTSRFALSFKASKRGATLRLARLYGTALLRLGGNGELSGTSDHTSPQAWAAALVAHSELYGENRADGRRLYRLPVIFPTDTWQVIMPHELVSWKANDKRYWSEYAADGHTRHCMTFAPAKVDAGSKRVIRTFGRRAKRLREDNGASAIWSGARSSRRANATCPAGSCSIFPAFNRSTPRTVNQQFLCHEPRD